MKYISNYYDFKNYVLGFFKGCWIIYIENVFWTKRVDSTVGVTTL